MEKLASYKLENPCLVQRIKFKKDIQTINTIDDILYYEYMGNSNFEWGAKGKSIKRIITRLADYGWFKIAVTDKKGQIHIASVFCHYLAYSPNAEPYIHQIIQGLADNKYHIEEWSGFDQAINKSGYSYEREKVNCWWDIDNDWFICFGEYHEHLLTTGIKAHEQYLINKDQTCKKGA